MTDSTLSEALKEAYASAPSAEIVYHTIEINHAAFSAPIRVVRDTIDLTAALEANNIQEWNFNSSYDSWTALRAEVALSVEGLLVSIESTDPVLQSPVFTSFVGSAHKYVQARVRRIAGSAAWSGVIYYNNGVHGFSGSYYKSVAHPNPTAMDEWAVVEWDMSTLTVGGTDWVDTNIRQIRFDIVQAYVAGEQWEIDWIQISANTYEPVTFVGFAFDVVPPEVQASQMPVCKIEIDNVSREILAQVELAIGSPELITVTYRQYLSSDLTEPQNDPPLTLTVFDISANVFRITATCGYGDFLNKRFPSEEYTAERFPGLIAS